MKILILLLICTDPVVIDTEIRSSGVSVNTKQGSMILTTWHTIEPYANQKTFKILPDNCNATIVEYNKEYDYCWLKTNRYISNLDTIHFVSKGNLVVQENKLKKSIHGIVQDKYFDVIKVDGSKWKVVYKIQRISGGYFGPGCSGSPVYKNKNLVGIMVGFDKTNTNYGYFVPVSVFLKNKQ